MQMLGRAIAAICLAPGLLLGALPLQASQDSNARTGVLMIPAIWVDPDGCQHWVLDDGWKGYMDIRLDRNGKPVCTPQPTCAVVGTDSLFFGSGEYQLSEAGRAGLRRFFGQTGARSYVINGHTDSQGGARQNVELSMQRARAVAEVAASAGARVSMIKGWGARKPADTNATALGRAHNRRVEIDCLNGE